MQINFYMSSIDRAEFHKFLFDRGGYLAPQYWDHEAIPIARNQNALPIAHRELYILKEDVFPSSKLLEPGWITAHRSRGGYYVHGPGIQYTASVQDHSGIHRGRLYTGLLSASSFLKLAEPRGGKPNLEHKAGVQAMEAFYKSCCRYVRRTHRKDDAGFYHGPGSDEAEASGVSKVAS